jgi:bifunctional DNA-binding transcriptional regulator/antitoxin component of YhaV-PrlF toxin-antitoxin module
MVVIAKELEREEMTNTNYNPIRPQKVKRVSVSSKRQISIPKEFYEQLHIGDEVVLELFGNYLVLRPVRENFDDFSEEILADLVKEGYTGQELINEFRQRKAQLRPALDSLIEEAMTKGEKTTIDDLFGDWEDEEI